MFSSYKPTVVAVFLLTTTCSTIPQHSVPTCSDVGTFVLVDTDRHRLQLCKAGSTVQEFPVAIGRGGRDKRQSGDNRTPLGVYPLDAPRESQEGFHTFIPVGYPTRSQRDQGFTGGDIGIHGPPQSWSWLGRLTTWKDWTRGCIAVGTESDIVDIAKWVKENQVKKVIIKPVKDKPQLLPALLDSSTE